MKNQTYDQADYNALMTSNLSATLATEGMRFDSAEDASVFFAQELDHIKANAYDKEYPQMSALALFPVSKEVNEGAETITYYSYDKTGFAEIIHNYATDLPRADAKGEQFTAKIENIGNSYGYSVQEMRASRMAGKSLDVRKGEAARYAVDRKINEIAWVGDKKSGLRGVLSEENNIPLYTLPTNASGTSTRFADKTPEECLNDIKEMLSFIDRLTLSVETPDVLALPADAYNYIAHTPRSDASDKTIMQWILSNMTQLKKIVKVPELNANANITPYAEKGLDVAFLFTDDAHKMSIEMPMLFKQHPVQPKNLEFIILCEARTAGAIVYYPLSALIIPGI
ncbi:MAG: DUF2184 domain-containing protein [Turicibacter sp.]|nr:DUF2184 domain-containing protein [Turicibacter sp.]